jgi:hypothetical protein
MAIKLNANGTYTDPRTREIYGADQIRFRQTGDGESGFSVVPYLPDDAIPLSFQRNYPSPKSGSGASWSPVGITTRQISQGAEGGNITTEADNLARSYWSEILPQLGYTGKIYETQTLSPGTLDEEVITFLSPEAMAAIDNFRQQGYELVRNPQRTDSGSKGITEYGLRLPSGELASTWERKSGAWYEQIAPYLGLVLPAILGIAGTKLGVTGTAAGTGAVTVSDTINALGANITGTSNELLNRVVGAAVVNGAKELIASGGDAETAIKGALTSGALAGAAGIAEPYIEKAADALSSLTGDEVAQLAGTDVPATDVAGNVSDVDVGGVGDVGAIDLGADPLYGGAYTGFNTAQSYSNLTDYGKDVYAGELALGKSPDAALISAFRAESLNFPTTGNALATGGAAAAAGNALATDQTPYTMEDLSPNLGGTADFTQGAAVTSPGGVATVDLTAGQTAGQAAGAGTVADTGAGLGTAGTAAGVAGAGALGAGAAGTVGGGLTVPPGAGLGEAGAITTPGGLDATVAGGTGITAGTTGGGGLDTSGLALGGALGAGAAAGSALPVGSAAAAGSAITPAAGLTGIPVVDDFLNYIGTPAGAAALGAFGSLAGGYLTGQAAKDAANIQAQSAQNALALQREQFEYQKGLLEPYRQAGESALGRLSGVMGLGGQPAQPQQLLDMDPGYAFRLGEGMKALERVQAARGNMLSGGAIKAGQRYAQDFASGEYGNAYNRLANIAGLGQTVGGQLGSAAQQFGQTAGETMSQGANALAAGRVGRTSGYMGGVGGAVGAYQNYQNQQQQNQLFGRFLDIYGRMGG